MHKNKISSKEVDILSHPALKSQDVSCPNIFLEFYDLTHCPGYGGEWKCHQRRHEYASDQYGVDSVEYLPCIFGSHLKCPYYEKNIELIGKFISQMRGLQKKLQNSPQKI